MFHFLRTGYTTADTHTHIHAHTHRQGGRCEMFDSDVTGTCFKYSQHLSAAFLSRLQFHFRLFLQLSHTHYPSSYSTICPVMCVSVAGRRPCLIATGLRKCDIGRSSASLLNRLQSVINATARSIAGLRRSEHITDALASFHWLRAPERIKFKLAVIVYRALHGTALHLGTYRTSFSTSLICRRDAEAGCALLDVRPSRLVTVGDRSFATAGPRLWNSLPVDVQSAPSQTENFRQSYSDIVL